ncbi:MAG: phosphoribosylformylglycinamidine synthase subunit PurL [bacterium]
MANNKYDSGNINISGDDNIIDENYAQFGLSLEEYKKIADILQRKPDDFEIGIFSAMWSEHCSYKSSKVHLKKLPSTGDNVIIGPGENAGVIKFDDDYVLVFKMESHNHPSFIEPFEGAATGVGGIMRDIFTMGARPIANLNSLRFGNFNHPKTPYYLAEVVKGIGFYGNCMGVPTVGGEVVFDSCYDDNILVNAFTIGIARKDGIFLSSACEEGNLVVYVGSATGMDGINGATMASGEFDAKKDKKRSTVQVGDPFTEKLLLEACLEAMDKKLIVSIQDMGAAGLTSSSFEMSENSGKGMIFDLDKIPLRASEMTPIDIMLSESQERMLLACKKENYKELEEIFAKWDLNCVVIGEVIKEKVIKFNYKSKPYHTLSVEAVVNGPSYDRPSAIPSYIKNIKQFSPDDYRMPKNFNSIAERIISHPNIASKHFIYRQYDYQIGTNTITGPGSSCAVLRYKQFADLTGNEKKDDASGSIKNTNNSINNNSNTNNNINISNNNNNSIANNCNSISYSNKGILLNSSCNSKYCYLNPYKGAMLAVIECARNISASGGTPAAITDCLNFASPEDPEIMWQFQESIRGITDAAIKFNTPAVSGNVSLYNETAGAGKIYPTPVIAMVGYIDDVNKAITSHFKDIGDDIYLLGRLFGNLGGSLFMELVHNDFIQEPLAIDIDYELKLQSCLRGLISERLIKSASDISEGGLFTALAESAISSKSNKNLGVIAEIHKTSLRNDMLLFSEFEQAFVISADPSDKNKIYELAKNADIEIEKIGKTAIDIIKFNNTIELKSDIIKDKYYGSIEKLFTCN